MNTKKYWILGAVAAIGLVGIIGVKSYALTDKQMTLSDIKKVFVFIQGFTAETKTAQLRKLPLQKYVAAKLKAAGVEVLSEEEANQIAGQPVLYVNISARKRKEAAAFIYHIDVGIIQETALVRDPSIHSMSITWNRGSLGYCSTNSLPDSIKGTIGYLMDGFVNDHKIANRQL